MNIKSNAKNASQISARQRMGFIRTGDVILPGFADMPRFSQTPYIKELNRIIDYAPAQDQKDLLMLMGLLAYAPKFIIRFLLWLASNHHLLPGFIAKDFRMLNLGIRGIFFFFYALLQSEGHSQSNQLGYLH